MRSSKRHSLPNMKFFEDLTKVATGALGSFTEVRQQIRSLVNEGVEQVMNQMDMVTRAEFERVEGLAQKARERQIELEKRVAVLEKQLQGDKKAPAAKAKTVTPKKKSKKA